jgi:hypothetical protein
VKLVWSLYSNTVPPHAQSKRGSFWWRDIFNLIDIYRGITSSQIGNGDIVLFWKDHWNTDQLLCDRFPRLFSFALNEDTSVAQFIRSEDQFQFFALPLSVQAYEELSALLNITREIHSDPSSLDERTFYWSSTQYSSSKYYKFIFQGLPNNRALGCIWKSKSLPKL